MDPPIYHRDTQQGTPEWNTLRRGLITASGIKALITPTGKPANNDTSRAYARKLAVERITNRSEESFYSSKMARGHILEPFARDIYSANHSPVVECGFITRDVGGVVIGYSPDGLVGDNGLIEIKSRDAHYTFQSILDGYIPSEHLIQVQTGILVSGRDWCDFVSYTPGLPLFRRQSFADPSLHEGLIEAARNCEKQIKHFIDCYNELADAYISTEFVDPFPTDEIL